MRRHARRIQANVLESLIDVDTKSSWQCGGHGSSPLSSTDGDMVDVGIGLSHAGSGRAQLLSRSAARSASLSAQDPAG
jgi:hypothetical protein